MNYKKKEILFGQKLRAINNWKQTMFFSIIFNLKQKSCSILKNGQKIKASSLFSQSLPLSPLVSAGPFAAGFRKLNPK
jgi:hypothetical protein